VGKEVPLNYFSQNGKNVVCVSFETARLLDRRCFDGEVRWLRSLAGRYFHEHGIAVSSDLGRSA
jgi:hypothetical protein